MNRNQKRRKRSTVWAISLTAVMMTLSTITVFAAGDAVSNGYKDLYMESRECVNESVQPEDDLQEFTEPYNPDALNIEIGEVQGDARSYTKFIDWTVKDDVFKRTYFFDASSGGTITVSASLDPTDKTIRLGIVTPSGVNRYVNATRDVYHEFALDETGSYCVYAENYSGSTVYVSGHYTVRP